MNKPILLILTFLCTVAFLNAQQEELLIELLAAEKVKEVKIAETFTSDSIRFPFSHIEVWDYRFDSSKIAYINTGIAGKSAYGKIKPADSWTSSLNHYFRKQFDSTAAVSLLFVLKSFWMQRGVSDKLDDERIRHNEPAMSGLSITVDIDVFAMEETSLKGLFRIDSFFLSDFNLRKGRLDEVFYLPFDEIATRISDHEQVKKLLQSRKKIEMGDIRTFYEKRFQIPVLLEPVKKGVFKTFAEFKANKPFSAQYEIKKGKYADDLYVRRGNTDELIMDYWGYCDGEFVYIKSGYNVFKAIRQQNTFEIYGTKGVSILSGQYYNYDRNWGGNMNQFSRIRNFFKPIQLNMDTGNLY